MKKPQELKMLVMDTSTPSMIVACSEGNRVIGSVSVHQGVHQSVQILPTVAFLLAQVGWKKEEIQLVGVGLGPGGFTGLRVAIATAQGLAFALQCPIVGFSSIEALLRSFPTHEGILVPCMDARKGEVYWGVYERTGNQIETLHKHLLTTPEKISDFLPQQDSPLFVFGAGALFYREELQKRFGSSVNIPKEEVLHQIQAQALVSLTHERHEKESSRNPWELSPFYIRPSDAEMLMGPPEGGLPLKGRLQPDGTILES